MHPLAWGRDLLELLYPRACARCEDDCSSPTNLCETCEGELHELAGRPGCDRCAMALPQESSPCPYCLGEGMHPFGRIVRLGAFDGPLRELIHKMKYHGRWMLAERLADRLVRRPDVRELVECSEVIVPVPLFLWKRWRRSYNQAEVIAARLGRSKVRRAVVRLFDTPSQTKVQSRTEREANVRDAFALVRPSAVAGRRVLIVDDVMTTGATLRAVARTLRPAKPASVNALVLAIADPRHRAFQKI